jgi:CBS domain-containing protein
MRVREVMTKSLESVSPNATLQEAASQMMGRDIGILPVCENNRVIGMVSDRDLVVRSMNSGISPAEVSVRDVMTRNVVKCYEDQLITEASQQMEENKVRRVVVVNRDEEMVGIVSITDIATQTGDDELTGNTLEKISEPGEPHG